MITQNFDLLMDFYFSTSNIEEIKEKKEDFLENINKNRPENLERIEKENIFIDVKTEKTKSYLNKYEYEYRAKFEIKISCKANFVNYARFCIELDSTLEEITKVFRFFNVENESTKIILKEIIFSNETYYG